MPRQVPAFDRYGNPIDDDDNIIPDGGFIRVPVTPMDGLQRAVHAFADGHRQSDGGEDNQLDATADAYQETKDWLQDAWRYRGSDGYERWLADRAANPPPRVAPYEPPEWKEDTGPAADARREYIDRITNAWRRAA